MAEEAADSCLQVLLYSVMGPYYDRCNVTARSVWYAGMTALSAHRKSTKEPVEPALQSLERVIAEIREQLTPDKLAVWLKPTERLYRAPAPW